MGKLLPCISTREAEFIATQKVFFVATAPLSPDHHVSVSPKSPGSSVVVIDPNTVAFADLTGSGAEGAAHVLQNGRITLLFVNIESGPPKILRLHGKGRVVSANDVDPKLLGRFPSDIVGSHGFRSVFVIDVDRVSTSCGYSMPVMKFERYRTTLEDWTEKKGNDGMREYRIEKNSFSIDGLPSVTSMDPTSYGPMIKQVSKNGYFYGEVVGEENEWEEGKRKKFVGKLGAWYSDFEGMVSQRPFAFGLSMMMMGIVLGSAFSGGSQGFL